MWIKDIAPSTELRKWFSHDVSRWQEFKNRYKKELDGKSQYLNVILENAKKGDVVLVYGAKDEQHNDAVVLKEYLGEKHSIS